MDNAIHIILNRQIGAFSQMNIASNNVANVSTGAYKKDKSLFTTHLQDATPAKAAYRPKYRQKQAEFSKLLATPIDFSAGAIKTTGRPLDMAIKGQAVFFSVETPQGIRYSQMGQFFVDNQGRLTTKEGYLVMGGAGGEPIFLEENDSQITILEDGMVTSTINGVIEERGNIAMFKFENVNNLKKAGQNFYETEEQPQPAILREDYTIVGGALEESNANPIQMMTELIEISRSVGGNAKFMKDMHELQIKTIDQLSE